jgi:hypothetical protein
MKKIILLGLALLLVLAVTESCKKKKDDNNNNRCGETEIKAVTSPASGTTDPPGLGPDFPLVVNIEPMPASGASVTVSAKKDGSSTTYFTETRDNASTSNLFQITGTPAGVTCVVEVTVTSKTCNTNQWKGSYRYSAK